MNVSSVKDLVPAKSIIPVPKPHIPNAVSYDLYPRQYRDQVVVTICVSDESDGNYGPDGRKLINCNYSEFIDTYA